ncbi:phosphatase PAP2 family protein [Paenibacillus sediminis]|uniref:Membrane-associated phospholipid phosphatase n=1 Tax=Paenibacillus sediminis TaxID=664909 RepID=A0ABS4H3E8_9BACL|nr:phosphatase PAP2 family protein [Paenibacillus sediminis]MBP1937039.1 membrane-associated phospholipid phosphatase [Paenibacillus sediminis]
MKAFFKQWYHALGILSIPIQGFIYVWITHHIGPNIYYDYGWLDTKIPFLRWFILPYVSWMPILYISFLYFAIVNRKIYWHTLIIYNIAVAISHVIFWVYPTHVPRPAVDSADLAGVLVNFIYRSDMPYNCFPSIHVMTSYLLYITIRRAKRHLTLNTSIRSIWSVLLWFIIASTVFVKQHSILDVIGGIICAEVTYQLFYYVISLTQRREKQMTGSY